MIGFLKGTLAGKQPPRLMLEVAGVGYELEAPMSTFYELPEVGSSLTLVTHLVVREDAHILYGFSTEAERALFRNLLKVSGIGARIALAVLSSMTVSGFYGCVRNKDLLSLTRVPGVGKKTAERLLVEMADRLPDDDGFGRVNGAPAAGDAEGEARSALLALGYRPAEVTRMLGDVDLAGQTAEALIREALRRVHTGAK
jgi:Holliday junction DNA helicase RuvA